MSKAIITESYLTDIADAIRAKLNVQTEYLPSDMAAAIASISGGGDTLAEWDFKTSLTDSINNLTATLYNGASRDSSGVTLASATDYMKLPNTVKANGRTYEVKVGSMTFDNVADDHRFFMSDSSSGFVYRSTGVWGFQYTGYATDSGITAYDYFANSTVKVVVDMKGFWHIYKDDVLVYEPNMNLNMYTGSNGLWLGSSAKSCTGVVFEGVKVY